MTDPLAQKCPGPLRHQIESEPRRSFDLILRVSEAGESQQRQIEQAGFMVRRRTNIVATFAVTGPGEALFPLLDRPWLLSVEPDQPVRAL